MEFYVGYWATFHPREEREKRTWDHILSERTQNVRCYARITDDDTTKI